MSAALVAPVTEAETPAAPTASGPRPQRHDLRRRPGARLQDHRTVNLGGGKQRIEFANVAAQIRSDTVSLAARDLTIVEQNFDFDLLSPTKLIEKAVGHEVTLVRTVPGTGAEVREKRLRPGDQQRRSLENR